MIHNPSSKIMEVILSELIRLMAAEMTMKTRPSDRHISPYQATEYIKKRLPCLRDGDYFFIGGMLFAELEKCHWVMHWVTNA